MKYYVLLTMMFLFTSCYSKYSKENHSSTTAISDSLYIETYLVYCGGVFASNSYSYYVTDSLNFRTYLYTITEDSDGLDAKLKHDVLFVYKITPKETLLVKEIDVEEERREGNFD